MSFSVHASTVPYFVKLSKNMLGWLDKAEAHAKTRMFDVNNFAGMRLAPDMLPFSRQIQIASDAAKNCVARLAGDEPPKWADDEKTIDELRARIRKTIAFVESIPAHRLEGAEKRDIVIPIGPDRTMRLTGKPSCRVSRSRTSSSTSRWSTRSCATVASSSARATTSGRSERPLPPSDGRGCFD